MRIRHADLPQANSHAIYQRMQKEREREAAEYRAEGDETAQRIRARAEREVTVLTAEATRESEILRGEGDAEKTRILGEAYSQDPDFFAFYRSMQAYQDALPAATRRWCFRRTAISSNISARARRREVGRPDDYRNGADNAKVRPISRDCLIGFTFASHRMVLQQIAAPSRFSLHMRRLGSPCSSQSCRCSCSRALPRRLSQPCRRRCQHACVAAAPVVPVRGAPATFRRSRGAAAADGGQHRDHPDAEAAGAGTPGLPNIPPGSPLADLFKDFLGARPQRCRATSPRSARASSSIRPASS